MYLYIGDQNSFIVRIRAKYTVREYRSSARGRPECVLYLRTVTIRFLYHH